MELFVGVSQVGNNKEKCVSKKWLKRWKSKAVLVFIGVEMEKQEEFASVRVS